MDKNGERIINLGTLIMARNIIDECSNVDINPKTAYKLMKIMDATEKDYTFYVDKVKSLIDKYGEKNDSGELIFDDSGNVRISHDVMAEAQAQIGELEAIEITISDKYLVSLDELDELKLSCRKMKAIMPFLAE